MRSPAGDDSGSVAASGSFKDTLISLVYCCSRVLLGSRINYRQSYPKVKRWSTDFHGFLGFQSLSAATSRAFRC